MMAWCLAGESEGWTGLRSFGFSGARHLPRPSLLPLKEGRTRIASPGFSMTAADGGGDAPIPWSAAADPATVRFKRWMSRSGIRHPKLEVLFPPVSPCPGNPRQLNAPHPPRLPCSRGGSEALSPRRTYQQAKFSFLCRGGPRFDPGGFPAGGLSTGSTGAKLLGTSSLQFGCVGFATPRTHSQSMPYSWGAKKGNERLEMMSSHLPHSKCFDGTPTVLIGVLMVLPMSVCMCVCVCLSACVRVHVQMCT